MSNINFEIEFKCGNKDYYLVRYPRTWADAEKAERRLKDAGFMGGYEYYAPEQMDCFFFCRDE